MKTLNKRTTVYFDPDIYRIIKIKAENSNMSVSELVDDAMRLSIIADTHDLELIREREGEETIPYESVIAELRAIGKL